MLYSPGRSSQPAPARPLRLISTDAQGRFSVGDEALAVLRSVSGPVAVATVCGRARQGKSFILNQIARSACGSAGPQGGAGFTVAATQKPCTKGIWLWSAPIPRTAPDGTKCVPQAYHLVLLDTEGVDAYDQTGTYSTQIFALAVLLSSLFVYNQLGAIDEAALERLALVSEVSGRLAGAAGSGPSASSFAPNFLWLLRDFYLELADEDGRPMTASAYLESALRAHSGTGPAAASKNGVRDSIKTLFPLRDCHTLVRPVDDEQALQALDQVPVERLRPAFVRDLQRLTAAVLSGAGPKRFGGDTLNGPALARLAQTYCAALNGGAVPNIASAWEAVAKAECGAAAEAAAARYDADFAAAAPPPEERALLAVHDAALRSSLAAFDSAAVGPPQLRKEARERLTAELERRGRETRSSALARAAQTVAELLYESSNQLAAAARAPGATYERVAAAVEAEAEKFARTAPGGASGASAAKLVTFLRVSIAGVLAEAHGAQLTELRRAASDADKRRSTAEHAAASAAQERDRSVAECSALRTRLETAMGTVARAEEAARSSAAAAAAATASMGQNTAAVQSAAAREAQAHAEAAAASHRASRAEEARDAAAREAEEARRSAQLQLSEAGRLRDAASRAQEEAEAAVRAARAEAAAAEARAAAAVQREEAAKAVAARSEAAARAGAAEANARIERLRMEAEAEKQDAVATAARQARVGGGSGGAAAAAAAPPPAVTGGKRPRGRAAPTSSAGTGAVAAMEVEEPEPASAAPGPSPSANPAAMSIAELKSALTEAGHEVAVFNLAAKKGKKADFVKLYGELMK